MSKQVKKPAEQIPTKIKNVDLLPNVFATDPNRKMLASTVDVMTSKGQLLPFKETYGLRNASNRIEEFFKVEEEQPRRESQGNNMLVVKDNSDSYLGKVSYYDIENYFAIKGFQLKDGVVLDKNVNVLDLPIDSVKLADFNMYYWLVNDLPACRIHLNPKAGGGAKFSMIDDLLGMPFATLVDDLTGKELELQNGMALYFTGEIDAVYKTASDTENNITEEPKIFFVYGVGSGIELFAKTDIEYRVPDVTFEKRPWDEYGKILEYPESSWDNRVWDGSRNIADTIEYVVQEKYTENTNHWQAIDRWYHVNTIRAVATFLGISTEDFVSSANKAVRPIISFNRHVKLHNWPTGSIREINSILRNTISYYQGQIEIQDQFGYKLVNDDIVVFERTAGIWKVSGLPGAATFTQVYSAAENDGAIIITPGRSLHYQVIYRNGQWNLAQNKTTKNQTPLFEFYLDNGTNVETLNGTTFTGGVILGFKPGDVYDEILGRYVDVNLIESESTLVLSSPNQINFTTDIDREFTYLDPVTNDEIKITGPYGYKSKDKLLPFYKSRNGLDFTKQMQDLLFVEPEGSEWSAEFEPVAGGFDSIHIFYDDVEKYKFYYNVDGYGLVRFSSKFSGNFGEEILPLVSGSKFKIICHDLPHAVTFYKAIVTDNITKPQTITSSYITNNGIQNGTIEIDLSDTVTVGSSVIDNELAAVDYKLLWTVGSPSNYKIAYVNPARKWNFLQSVFVKDQTYPLYEGYDYIVNDITLSNGDLSYYKQISDAGSLNKIANSYDKICVESVIENPISKTAPVSFTDNPLNAKIDTIQYYSLYQHAAAIKSNSTNIVKFNNSDVEVSTPTFFMGGGTIFKHNDPLSKFAVTATNLPYELTDLFIRQGKHYDLFLNKLKVELEKIVDTIEVSNYSSLDILNRALNGIYVVDPSDDLFWSHSNMIGWGTQDSDYSRATVTVSSGLRFNLNNSSYNFENISHRTGKESLLHISYNGRILLRGYDYWLNSTGTEYTQIEFRSFYANKQVVISQWFTTFRSLVPASLAKIGLTPVYRPEIYADTSYLPHAYFMIRHDGTKYFLKAGIDATTGLPLDPTEYYLYEYEKAVWSSIARDVERNNQVELLETSPGYFRDKPYTYNQYRLTIENEVRQWMLENSIFVMENNDYNATDGFTLKYRVGSGDGETVEGSWRAIYEYMYDTDRPHTHPWEMLGYTLKPWWWDTHYSWTDATKRIALKKALRLGKVSNPGDPVVINPAFARNIAIDYATPNTLEDFPVTNTGALMSPKDFINYLDSVTNLTTVVTLSVLNENTNWAVGNLGPYEQIFLNSHRGLAARVRARYLASPGEFMSSNWVPGQTVKNAWGHKVDRTTQFWQQGLVAHDYHRKLVDGDLVYTGGIESLYSEFCLLNNKDYESEVIAKFNNLVVNKEFMLGGFTNKDNIRIQSTSIGTQKTILFIPEENYQVRTVKHYPHKEIFYSGMKIVWDGESYTINGFATEFGQFPYYLPKETSDTAAREIGNVVIKEKLDYSKEIAYLGYGSLMNNRQEIYDFIIGYGKYLEDLGVVYEEPEGGDIRNWQLSAKQFIFWSNDLLAPGNFIDLNPNADFIKISTPASQLENLEGTNENVGQCVDRFGRPLFSKDLLVMRDDYTVIKTKNTEDGIYGIKLAFVNYETVVHLDSTSIFNDIYFEPAQNLTKRSFIIGGKKTVGWNGSLNSPGYIFNGDELLPNLDSLAEVGRNLLDVENVVFDPVIRDASRNQFGLSRNPELRQLFIEESNETLFKTAITYNKGTRQVFDSLNPLTHQDGSKTIAYEEYMVRVGEFGNTKNIEFYEFELKSEDMVFDSQVIKFVPTAGGDVNTIYVTHDSDRWVYKPYNKNLQFKVNTETTIKVLSQKGSPILPGDTDLAVESIEDLPDLYDKFADLWSIPQYVPTVPHKLNDKVRVNGRVYQAVKNVPPAPWADVSDDFIEVNEPALPNVYVNNYKKPNPNLSNSDPGPFTPATWQVLQTTDNKLAITETCPGPNDVSKARVTTDDSHKVTAGDYVLIVNATTENSSVNGIWEVDSVDPNNNSQFYINTRIKETIKAGKVFVFRPVRFKNTAELALATADKGYDWTPKVNDTAQRISTAGAGVDSIPVTALPSAPPVPTPAPTPAPVISGTLLMTYYVPATGASEPEAVVDNTVNVDNLPGEYDEPAITPSGYDKKYPIAIVDNDSSYKVYQIEDPSNLLSNIIIKQETFSLDVDDIEHLIVYDYDTNKTIAKIELFNPDTLDIPQVFKNDVDIIGRVDPAKYNRTTDNFKSVYTSLGWYEEYVGRRWWNTSSVQLADYNSGDDYTKANYWGMTNSNEPLEVYEWTKSTVHPSKWNELVKNKTIVFDQLATGEVYVDRSLGVDNYHWVEEEDYVSGKTYTVYYFWVKNKKTIAPESKWARTYTTDQLSKALLNPSAAGIPWWCPINADTIVVKGIKPYLNNNSTVVQIKKKLKGEEKHQQWVFVSENNTVETIPEWLHLRLRDSLSAHVYYSTTADYTAYNSTASYNRYDVVKYSNNFYICRVYMKDSQGNPRRPAGLFSLNDWYRLSSVEEISDTKVKIFKEKSVPDILRLHRFNRYGNTIRPYIQSWFKDLREARRTFIRKLNEVLLNVNVVDIPKWPNTILNNTNYTEADQSIDMTKFWTYADFRSEDFDSTRIITATLNDVTDLYSQSFAVGNYIRVNVDFRNYIIYERTAAGGFSVVYKRNGTIQFNEEFDPYGWDSTVWDGNLVSWDYDLNLLFNAILNSMRTEIFLGRYLKNYSVIMCSMFRYVLSEQVNVDWLAKSSTIEPVNLIAQTLENSDYLKRDEISSLINFYGSVKSYRDKIRSSTINKVTLDLIKLSTSERIDYEDITDADTESAPRVRTLPIQITGFEIN